MNGVGGNLFLNRCYCILHALIIDYPNYIPVTSRSTYTLISQERTGEIDMPSGFNITDGEENIE